MKEEEPVSLTICPTSLEVTEIVQDDYDDPPPLSLNSTLFTIESSSSTQPQMVHLDVSRILLN